MDERRLLSRDPESAEKETHWWKNSIIKWNWPTNIRCAIRDGKGNWRLPRRQPTHRVHVLTHAGYWDVSVVTHQRIVSGRLWYDKELGTLHYMYINHFTLQKIEQFFYETEPHQETDDFGRWEENKTWPCLRDNGRVAKSKRAIKKCKNSASRDHDKSVLEKITSSHKNASNSSSSKTNTSDDESRCFRGNANMARDLRRATENMLCMVFISRIHCLSNMTSYQLHCTRLRPVKDIVEWIMMEIEGEYAPVSKLSVPSQSPEIATTTHHRVVWEWADSW